MKDVIALISGHADKHPGWTAVIEDSTHTSYGEFFKLVINIAHQFREINPSPVIIIDLKQGMYAYAVITAVLYCGGTYCPLYPEAPVKRKKQIIEEVKPDLIVVDELRADVEFTGYPVTTVSALAGGSRFTPFDVGYDQEGIAYVIHTSGSTGTPKGVQICRKALNKFLEWSVPAYGAGKNDIWGQFSFLSFDLSIVDIFTSLCSGAALLVISKMANKLRPAQTIAQNKVTIWHSVPSAVELMIKSEATKPADLSSLRLMSFCGEPLRKYQLSFVFSKQEGLVVFNTYGPTEGTLFCTCQELTSADYLEYVENTTSIGHPIPGWQFDFEPVNAEEKEVIIYGNYIGKGYLSAAADTGFKKRLINGALRDCFETGDLVMERNGNLFFSARKDRQVKIHGHRVEPDEIDACIALLLNKTSITTYFDNALHTFIEMSEAIDDTQLRALLAQRLEAYKMPRTIKAIPEIPRNANFKVNYPALIQFL